MEAEESGRSGLTGFADELCWCTLTAVVQRGPDRSRVIAAVAVLVVVTIIALGYLLRFLFPPL